MKTYVIGDIHGCFRQLKELILKVGDMNLEENRLIFLGDYMDRGPDSSKVIDYIIDLESKYGKDHVIALKGNHEDMCLHFYGRYNYNDGGLGRMWDYNGGYQTLQSYESNEVSEDHLEWMLTLRTHFEDENFIYVHAGLLPERAPDSICEYDKIWVRYDFIYSTYDWGKVVVFGHTASKGDPLLMYSNKIGLDTGCVYGFKLTCMMMEDRNIWQVGGHV